jgi:hypothetical protein
MVENKKQINLRLEEELYEFIQVYAKLQYKTVSGIIREMIVNLMKENGGSGGGKRPPLIID